MAISTAARKAKGRSLQNKIKNSVLKHFPHLENDDVKSTSMGQIGEDIQLSPAARKVFPYSVEAKKHKAFAVYGPYEQAAANCKGYEPVLVIEGDRKKPLAIVDFEHFMELTRKVADVS